MRRAATSTGCGYQTLLLPGSQPAGQELGTKHMVSATRQMQGKESDSFAESGLHLVKILFNSSWTPPSSLSPILCSCNNAGNKQAPLGARQLTMGTVLASSPWLHPSSFLPHVSSDPRRARHSYTGTNTHGPGACVTFLAPVSPKKLWAVLLVQRLIPTPQDMAVGRGCHSDTQPFKHQVQS